MTDEQTVDQGSVYGRTATLVLDRLGERMTAEIEQTVDPGMSDEDRPDEPVIDPELESYEPEEPEE